VKTGSHPFDTSTPLVCGQRWRLACATLKLIADFGDEQLKIA
jgi:hypothetical protein